MKLKIKKKFRDKYTNEIYAKDDVIEVTDSRAEEILSDERNLASVYKEKPAKRFKK